MWDGDPIGTCVEYYADANDATNPDISRIKKLTGWKTADDVFGRETGARLMTGISAEIAADQHYNFFGILEGAPFQGERALFTNDFAHSMFDTDYILYLRIGMTYKF
jgi:hypothetical protein